MISQSGTALGCWWTRFTWSRSTASGRARHFISAISFVVTSSLTKAFGLSGLRCGWVLASPELAQRMWRINDLYGATPAHPAELLSVIALDHLDKVAARAQQLLETNRKSMNAFLDSRNDLDFCRPEHGTIVFPEVALGRCRSVR